MARMCCRRRWRRRSRPFPAPVRSPIREGWLFRIAHNAALDFLRRRARQQGRHSDEDLDMIADPDSEIDRRQAAAASLRTLMRLPVAQRSSVILMDVLGHSLEEIRRRPRQHRARGQGRAASRPQPAARTGGGARRPPAAGPGRGRPRRGWPPMSARFNARDFDALRDLLADEVRVEVVNRDAPQRARRGRARYFTNYGQIARLATGAGTGRRAAGGAGPRSRRSGRRRRSTSSCSTGSASVCRGCATSATPVM